ncbi:MAG: ABC transporter permease [Armatimonadetes bacterium]|nr:MAG: ABC transporter permease [Armatimonadota bacterium]
MVGYLLVPLTFIGEVTLLLLEGAKRAFRRPFELDEVIRQMAFVGVASVPIVLVTTFASGAVMSLYIAPLLVESGASTLAGGAVGLTVARELAPVLAGIMVAARCGSAMAAQISSMAVTEQLDALRSLAVHPYNYLLVPRLLAGLLMVPTLCIIGVFSGMTGAMLVAGVHGIPASVFLRSVEVYVESWDFVGGLLKAAVFGLTVAVVACRQGFNTKGGAVGVGKATTSAVVISMVLIYIFNYFLADLFY